MSHEDWEGWNESRKQWKREQTKRKMAEAIRKIQDAGYTVHQGESELHFLFKGEVVRYFPLKSWASGKSIKDCRGLSALLKQISNVKTN